MQRCVSCRLSDVVLSLPGFNFIFIVAVSFFDGFNGIAGYEGNEAVPPELFNMLQFVFYPARIVQKFLGSSIVDRKSTRLNSSHVKISYAVFCLKKKIKYR